MRTSDLQRQEQQVRIRKLAAAAAGGWSLSPHVEALLLLR
jgi:hypothetical protein